MRVVAGVVGGRRLEAPRSRGSQLRPTSERVREALFASLGSMGVIDGARVLDLYAGTGAMGIEALSRGASAATFVDDDLGAVAAIKANLATTGFTAQARVVRGDAQRFLDGTTETFDIVLADPPYGSGDWQALLARVKGGLVAMESRGPVDAGPAWEVVRTRRYGATTVTLVRPADPTTADPTDPTTAAPTPANPTAADPTVERA